MSGGSYDYAYQHINSFADVLRGTDTDPLRRAFADHLRLVSEAMFAIEWVDSCDWERGREHESIQKVLDHKSELNGRAAIMQAADNAVAAVKQLREAIEKAGGD